MLFTSQKEGIGLIDVISILLLCFGLSFFILFLYSLNKQRNRLAVPFAFLCLSIAIYITGYAFELQADNTEELYFFLKVEYFGAPLMSGFWLLFTYKTRHRRPAPIQRIMLMMVFPILTLFLGVTNEVHHLIYTSMDMISYKGHLLSSLEKGLWYYLNILYAYSVEIYGMTIFFKDWRKQGYHRRTQSFWMLFGSIWPILVNFIYISGNAPLNLDLTPFGLCISGIFFYIAIFRYGFLDFQEIMKEVVFMEISEGILVLDNKNRLVDYNLACVEIFSWLDLCQIGTDISLFPEGKRILEQKSPDFELKLINNRKSKYYVFRKTTLTEGCHALGSVYFIQDISDQKEMIRALHDIESHDSLTEVYNRRRLLEEMEKELQRLKRCGGCLSILLMDIDHFKLVNEQYGHQAGDEVLRILAGACSDKVRKTDILGRYGGEEFLIILSEATEDNAYFIAENIRKFTESLVFLANGETIKITVSIGIKTAHSSDISLNTEGLIQSAGKALNHAKNNGRNRTSQSSR